MATYKLTYFPCRGRGELIRLIFAQAEVEYENVRLPYYPFGSAEWAALKKSKRFSIPFKYVCICIYRLENLYKTLNHV